MKAHRFFIDDFSETDEEIILTDQEVLRQMKSVLRLEPGDPVILLNKKGTVYHTRVKVLLKKESIFTKENTLQVPKSDSTISLYFSILKKDKSEWVLQKCTELGVNNFTPLITERTEKTNLRRERSELIIKEAAEQSEKAYIPEFHETVDLEMALENLSPEETFYLDMDGEKISVQNILNLKNINLFVGPEGGWSLKDKEVFKGHNIKSLSLGDFVLRAETASVAVVSAIKIG